MNSPHNPINPEELPGLVRLMNALASDCENTDGWEDAAPDCRKAADTLESLAAEVLRYRSAIEKALDHRYGDWTTILWRALGGSEG